MDISLNQNLIKAMRERYERLGVIINEIETPMLFSTFKFSERNIKAGRMTIPQKIKQWIDKQPAGTTWKNKQMFAETGVTYKKFDNAKKRNKAFDKYIKSYQIDLNKPKLGYRK